MVCAGWAGWLFRSRLMGSAVSPVPGLLSIVFRIAFLKVELLYPIVITSVVVIVIIITIIVIS